MKRFFVSIPLLIISLSGTSLSANELYRSVPGDSGKYYVLKSQKLSNGTIKVLSSRIGKGNAYTDFTELKINCRKKQYLVIAGSNENGAKKKPSKKLKNWSKGSKWSKVVNGSSKYDLIRFICKKY